MENWFAEKYKVKKDNKMPYFGETNIRKRLIKINVKKSKATGQKGELLDSINHERLHAIHPHASEDKIQKMVRRSTSKLSKKSKRKLYKLIPNK